MKDDLIFPCDDYDIPLQFDFRVAKQYKITYIHKITKLYLLWRLEC